MPGAPETEPWDELPGAWRGRRLDPSRPYKPLDVGEAGVAVSVGTRSRLVSVSQAHPEHGMVRLAAHLPFNDHQRYNADAVRRYRRRLSARGAPGFGLRSPTKPAHPRRTAWLIEDAIPATGLGPPGNPGRPARDRPAVATFVPHPDDVSGARGVIQALLPGVDNDGRPWGGRFRLARAAYTQLTEGGPLPAPSYNPTIATEGRSVVLSEPALGWAVALSGELERGARVVRGAEGIEVDARLRDGGRVVILGLGWDDEEAADSARRLASIDPDEALERQVDRWRQRWGAWREAGRLDFQARRAVAYALACCAFPVGEAVCLVTDHRILPLAWTRDAYFVARALLAWCGNGGPTEAADVVRRHLTWLFEVAERPDGWWARSHLVGGQPKDGSFQVDQQLYPLLELAEYVEATADGETMARHREAAEEVLRRLDARRATEAALYATEESPADEPVFMPYLTSNNILAWRTFTALDRLGVGGGRLRPLAEAVARSIREHLVVEAADGSRMLAYASDLRGQALRYHDANDLPLALAPRWGFCSPDDSLWKNTIRFALSPDNPGFFDGERGGLGSTHSPGPWPLGHVQALIVAGATGDRRAVERAEDVLRASAQWDGALPEATDPRTALPWSRPWFAWPSAALAAEILGS